MSDVHKRFLEFQKERNELSLEEMVSRLKVEEPEFADLLDNFMEQVHAVQEGAYPYPADWRRILENTGISKSLLYMKNTFVRLQEEYNEKNQSDVEKHIPNFLSRIAQLFQKNK